MTHGAGSTGLLATTGGTINATQTSVLTDGAASNGLWAKGSGSAVNLSNSSILTSGIASHAAVAGAGGLVTGAGSTLQATGVGAMAVYVGGDPGRASNAQFTGSTLTSTSGPAIGVAGLGNVTLTNSTARSAGEWLRVGTINDFAAPAPPEASYPGVAHPDGIDPPLGLLGAPPPLAATPAVANVVLSGSNVTGSAFTAPGSVSNLELRDNSTWTVTGNSNVTNLLNDPSLIQFTAPTGDPTLLSSYKTLTVVNYIRETMSARSQTSAASSVSTGVRSPRSRLRLDSEASSPAVAAARSAQTALPLRSEQGPSTSTTTLPRLRRAAAMSASSTRSFRHSAGRTEIQITRW